MADDLTHKPAGPHWVSAVFESQADAQKAKDDLMALGIAADDIKFRSAAAYAKDPDRPTQGANVFKAILDIFVFMPSQDRMTFEEALRRGGVVLAVRAGPELYEQAIDTLDRDGAIDLEEREMTFGQGNATIDRLVGDTEGATVEHQQDVLQNPDANPDMRERIGVGTSDMTAGIDVDPPNAVTPSVRDTSHGRRRVRSYFGGTAAPPPGGIDPQI